MSRVESPSVSCARLPSAPPGPDPADLLPGAWQTFQRVGAQLGVAPGALRDRLLLLDAEIRGRLPAFLTAVSLVALLPVVAAQSRGHRRGRFGSDDEDLGHDVVARILTTLFGSWPHGNVGAWVAVVRRHLLADRERVADRRVRRMGRRRSSELLDELEGRTTDRSAWVDLSLDLTPEELAVIRLQREGWSWEEIARERGVAVADVQRLADRIRWLVGDERR